MTDISQAIAQDVALLIPIIAIGGGFAVAIVAIIFGAIKSMSTHSEREKSRREIAAYVAEGSMTPQDGAQLLNAAPVKST
jgi:flagellar basal body-associated protein FliL